MNLKEVTAYIYRKKESDIHWAKRKNCTIYGRFTDGTYFKITGIFTQIVPDEVA